MTRSRNSSLLNNTLNNGNTSIMCSTEGTIYLDWIDWWRNQRRQNNGDVRVIVENQTFNLHSFCLCFWSEYFHSLLSNRNLDEIKLQGVKKNDFRIIVDHLYYGRGLRASVTEVVKILPLAERFGMRSLIKECCDYILSSCSTNIRYIIDVLIFLCSSEKANEQWMLNIGSYVVEKLYKFESFPSLLKNISFDVLKAIISSSLIPEDGVNNKIEISSYWIKSDFQNRVRFIPDVVDCITGTINDFPDYLRNRPLERFNREDVDYLIYDLLDSCKNTFTSSMRLKNIGIDYDNLNELSCKNTELDGYELRYQFWRQRMKLLMADLTDSDITVGINEKKYHLNHWVLSITSKYFNDLPHSSANSITLEMEENDFEIILNYMYGEELAVTWSNLNGIIRGARYLKMNSCKKEILKFLSTKSETIPDVFNLLNICAEESDEIWDFAKKKILKNLDDVKQSVSCLTVNCFKKIVSSKSSKIMVSDLIALCRNWILHHTENRLEYLPELYSAMKPILRKDDIQNISEFEIALGNLSCISIFSERLDESNTKHAVNSCDQFKRNKNYLENAIILINDQKCNHNGRNIKNAAFHNDDSVSQDEDNLENVVFLCNALQLHHNNDDRSNDDEIVLKNVESLNNEVQSNQEKDDTTSLDDNCDHSNHNNKNDLKNIVSLNDNDQPNGEKDLENSIFNNNDCSNHNEYDHENDVSINNKDRWNDESNAESLIDNYNYYDHGEGDPGNDAFDHEAQSNYDEEDPKTVLYNNKGRSNQDEGYSKNTLFLDNDDQSNCSKGSPKDIVFVNNDRCYDDEDKNTVLFGQPFYITVKLGNKSEFKDRLNKYRKQRRPQFGVPFCITISSSLLND